MDPIVLQLSQNTLAELINYYKPYIAPNKDSNKKHFFKINGTSISVYSSGKVLFQGGNVTAVAGIWQDNRESSNTNVSHPLTINPSLTTIGTDEVGNGSYFGGIAVVASFVKPDQHQRLKELGVDDSKSLTDQKILKLAPILEKEITHQSLLLSPQKYNEVVPGRHNAVSIKVALHNQAIFLLLQKVEAPQQIIIDAFTSPANYQKYLTKETNHFKHPFSLIEKAESQCLAVAVSSIIARKLFLEQLQDLGQQVGYQLPSGAGMASDKVASQILAVHGSIALEKIAKLHFKNTEKAEKLLRRT